jgi:hypothetical protein
MGRHSDALLAQAVNVALAPKYSQKSRAVSETVPDFSRPPPRAPLFPVPADYGVLLREGNSLTIRASAASRSRSRTISRSRLPSRSALPAIFATIRVTCTCSERRSGSSSALGHDTMSRTWSRLMPSRCLILSAVEKRRRPGGAWPGTGSRLRCSI